MAAPESRLPGALVVSLDFELSWGMRDLAPLSEALCDELRRSRDLVTQIASELSQRQIRATWATVGFLFASTRQELEQFEPQVRPAYSDSRLDPYAEALGEDERADPLHLAGSIVRQLSSCDGQEVGSHTFSHFYCLEPGQDENALRADLAAAKAIAQHAGIEVSSLVLPRNQWNPRYARAVRDSGFSCYRGPQPSLGHAPSPKGRLTLSRRAARLAETYLGTSPPPTTSWAQVGDGDGLCNVPASTFLRPYSPRRRALEPLRLRRIVSGMRDAARRARIFHLWWHPHNFARHPRESFDLLRTVLDEFALLAESDGMCSLAMGDVPALVSAPSG